MRKVIENLRTYSDEEKLSFAVVLSALFLLVFGSFWVKYSLDYKFKITKSVATEESENTNLKKENNSQSQKASAADPFSKTFFEIKSKVKSVNKEDNKKDGIKPVKIEI